MSLLQVGRQISFEIPCTQKIQFSNKTNRLGLIEYVQEHIMKCAKAVLLHLFRITDVTKLIVHNDIFFISCRKGNYFRWRCELLQKLRDQVKPV